MQCLIANHLFHGIIALFFIFEQVKGFGAGFISSFSCIEGKNFRHGDIEETLDSILLNRNPILSKITEIRAFDSLAIKRVYFGNWLRDYSQAIDVGTLSYGISPELIRVVLWVMSFIEFGYGTFEFEVTKERLGVYRAEEHIDNPIGYPSDAHHLDSRLRGPVDPMELEIDPDTGMKNYIANESGGWPTSSEYVKRTLLKCIDLGRKYTGEEATEGFRNEALRLLGQALHTLEDFSAHSNYCELVLIDMGYNEVFPFVGEQTKIQINNKTLFPIVTGSFGALDFVHSLMGGAQDSLSQMEIKDIQSSLEESMNQTNEDKDIVGRLNRYFDLLPFDISEKTSTNISKEMHELQNSTESTSPLVETPELLNKIYLLFSFKDRILKTLDSFIIKFPFLPELNEKISDAITIFILSSLKPILTPIINNLIATLHSGTEMVVNDEEQYRVFRDPYYHNPTHSKLSKDHFVNVMNQPAGLVAVELVAYLVPFILNAWDDPEANVANIINEACSVFHHPALATTNIQMVMRNAMENWIISLDDPDTTLDGLSKAGILEGRNLNINIHNDDFEILENKDSSHLGLHGTFSLDWLFEILGFGKQSSDESKKTTFSEENQLKIFFDQTSHFEDDFEAEDKYTWI